MYIINDLLFFLDFKIFEVICKDCNMFRGNIDVFDNGGINDQEVCVLNVFSLNSWKIIDFCLNCVINDFMYFCFINCIFFGFLFICIIGDVFVYVIFIIVFGLM